MLDKLKEKKISASAGIRSRIYHNIANIKKGANIQQKEWRNDHNIECIKRKGYFKLLSEAEL
jgi:hypothetical protein